MKFRHWFCSSLLGIAIGTVGLAQRGEPEQSHEPVTELGQWMDRMNTAFRKLRRQADNSALNASSVELVAVMQESAAKAVELVPAKTEDLPESERAKFVERYREELGKMIAQLGELEAAFRADDNAKALQLIREIGASRKQGHDEFKKDTH